MRTQTTASLNCREVLGIRNRISRREWNCDTCRTWTHEANIYFLLDSNRRIQGINPVVRCSSCHRKFLE